MALEFMTGATVFALINFFILVALAFFLFRIGKKLYIFYNDDSESKKVDFFVELLCVGSLLLFFLSFGSVAQPKLSLDPVQNRELIEYQENNEEVVIETPPPRTEELQGFESLK